MRAIIATAKSKQSLARAAPVPSLPFFLSVRAGQAVLVLPLSRLSRCLSTHAVCPLSHQSPSPKHLQTPAVASPYDPRVSCFFSVAPRSPFSSPAWPPLVNAPWQNSPTLLGSPSAWADNGWVQSRDSTLEAGFNLTSACSASVIVPLSGTIAALGFPGWSLSNSLLPFGF